MKNVIDLGVKKENDWGEKEKKAFQGLSRKDADLIVRNVTMAMLFEVEYGLGLVDMEGDRETPFFDGVEKIYKAAAHGCYLCDPTIDPNGEEFTGCICPACQQKLGNVMKFFELDFKKFLPMAGTRKVQKKTRR